MSALLPARNANEGIRRSGARSHDGSERGSVLLAVMLLAAVSIAMSAALIMRAASLASELRARRSVLCARYAALGGLALGTARIDAAGTAALVGPGVDSLAVFWVRLGPSWCVLRAIGACRPATRTLDRTMPEVTACSTPPQ